MRRRLCHHVNGSSHEIARLGLAHCCRPVPRSPRRGPAGATPASRGAGTRRPRAPAPAAAAPPRRRQQPHGTRAAAPAAGGPGVGSTGRTAPTTLLGGRGRGGRGAAAAAADPTAERSCRRRSSRSCPPPRPRRIRASACAGPLGRCAGGLEYAPRLDDAAGAEIPRRYQLRPRVHRQVRRSRGTTTASRSSTSRPRRSRRWC